MALDGKNLNELSKDPNATTNACICNCLYPHLNALIIIDTDDVESDECLDKCPATRMSARFISESPSN